VVNLSDGTQDIHTFTGFSTNNDIGVLGFDENNDPGVFVTSAFAYAGDVTSTGAPILAGSGSWDEYKQIEFSVPGQVASVPETRTWAMVLMGFGLLGLAAAKKRGTISIA